jgi:hypothetical protein
MPDGEQPHWKESQPSLIFTFQQKRNVFLSVPLWSVRLFLTFLQKRNAVPFFWNPGSCGFRGIAGIPAGMHNLGGGVAKFVHFGGMWFEPHT